MSDMNSLAMSVEDALAIAKIVPGLQNLSTDNCSQMMDKLMLLAMKRAGADGLKSYFEQYLGKFGYEKQQCGCNSTECYNINRNCNGEGWTWMRWTGPGDYMEINRSETFRWECSLMSFAYEVYVQSLYENIDLEEIIKKQNYQSILELPTEMELEYFVDELSLEDVEQEELVVDEVLELLVYGAFYIKCTIDGVLFPEQYKEYIESLYCRIYQNRYMDVMEYFDYFLNYLHKEAGLSKESATMALPFFLNMLFGYHREPEHECTPVFYVFQSTTMARYKLLKEKYSEYAYIPQMDAMLKILEDPIVFACIDTIPEYYHMPAHELWDASCISGAYSYGQDAYVCVYYYYSVMSSKLKSNVFLNNFFFILRQAFDRLLFDMEEQYTTA